MRRFALPVTAVATALLLAACTIEVSPPAGPPANTVNVSATTDPSTALHALTLPGGASQVYRVNVPQSVAGKGLLYVELNKELDLEVMTGPYGQVSYSAASSSYFGRGHNGIDAASATSAALEASTIMANAYVCRGSCVLLKPTAGTVYVRVTNPGAAPTSVALYVYGEAPRDPHEPGNDTMAGAYTFSGNDSGAIETVDDVDYFYFSTRRYVTFDDDSNLGTGIALEAWVLDGSGEPMAGPYYDGQSFDVFAGEYVRVWAHEEWQAASSGRSRYYIYLALD